MQITIQDTTFVRLQRHAEPLIDEVDMIINRALDALERGGARPTPEGKIEPELRIDPRELPNLKHTKVLDASIEGERIPRANWNRLLRKMIRLGMERIDFANLLQICPVPMVKGRKEDEGFRYLSDLEISIQSQDSNGACRAITTAAQTLNVSVEIVFMWRQKRDAVHPGEKARLLLKNQLGRNALSRK